MKKTIATMLLLVSAAACHALQATIAWNPVAKATDGKPIDVDGYRLYFGTVPGEYSYSVDVGPEASAMLDVAYGTKYYFAVKAVAGGRESALSSEIAWTSPSGAVQAPPSSSTLSIETVVATPLGPVAVGAPVFAAAGFADSASGTHAAQWNWGDGAASIGDVNETDRIVYGSHAYATPGVYPVELGMLDSSGGTAVAEGDDFIVAYNPNGGFVAGGGWIAAPEGKASFGFVAAYAKGNKSASQDCEFRFKSGTLNVYGTVCNQLVVKGRNNAAQISGSGIMNGSYECEYTIWASDGATDTCRVEIRTVDASGIVTVVYDSGSELPLGGGAVAIKAR